MPRPTEETRCENCQWYQPETRLWKSSCKVYPPTMGSGHCGHPTTDPHDWCREFTPIRDKASSLASLESMIYMMPQGGFKRELLQWVENEKSYEPK